MKQEDVNRLITDRVDEIDDPDIKRFIRDILRFERSKMDLDQPHFKDDYKNLIQQYALKDDE
jgi:hypothetical protein